MAIELRGSAPLFEVFDMPAAFAFYRGVLGFHLDAGSSREWYRSITRSSNPDLKSVRRRPSGVTRAISSPRATSRGCRPRSRRAPCAQRC
jgi:hypothetical protein